MDFTDVVECYAKLVKLPPDRVA